MANSCCHYLELVNLTISMNANYCYDNIQYINSRPNIGRFLLDALVTKAGTDGRLNRSTSKKDECGAATFIGAS